MLKTYIVRTEALEDNDLFGRLYSRMPYCRREKIDRMIFKKDKRLSLAAGALLEHALMNEGVRDREIVYIGSNKPVLKTVLYVSISHIQATLYSALSRIPTWAATSSRSET